MIQPMAQDRRDDRPTRPARALGTSSFRRICWLLAALLISTPAAADPAYSKAKRFRIPFQFDADELQRLGAREIQLFVSLDQGNTWKQVESVLPDAGRFTYEAVQDGEHWFSVRTIAGEGLSYPAGPHQPGLKVIVDTVPPELTIGLRESEPGRVRLSWSVTDRHPDLSTLELEYLESEQTDWESVHIRPMEQGQTTWTVSSPGLVKVRGRFQDLAGNVVEAAAECRVSQSEDGPNARPDFSRPVAADQPLMPSLADHGADEPALTAIPPMPPIPPAAPEPVSPPAGSATLPEANTPAVIRPAKTSPPPVREVPAADDNDVRKTEHLVNSDTFRIGYQVENVGPSGVSKVDLYITEDGGNVWFHYGSDPDKTSPYQVKVPRDGTYGFTFRITSGAGLVAIPPQPGERPDIVVIVDRVPPVATLHPIRHGQEQNQILIEWNAHDRQLADQPVSLFYTSQSTGPWEVIENRLPNTGRYVWTVPASLERKFYIRLEVRDAAGNVTRVETHQPFTIDHARPRAQVTEVEALKADPN